MSYSQEYKQMYRLVSFLVIGLAGCLVYDFFVHTWSYSLWNDEVLTLNTIFYSPLEIIESLYFQGPEGYSNDFFPPLYYVLCHWLYKLGYFEYGLRLFNFICLLLSFILVLYMMRRSEGDVVAWIFVLLVATSVFTLNNVRIIRPYGLYAALQISSVSCIIAGLVNRDLKFIIASSVFNSLSLYAHYASIGNVFAQVGVFCCFPLFDSKNKKFYMRSLLVIVLGALVFVPWIPGYMNVMAHTKAIFGPSVISTDSILNSMLSAGVVFSDNVTVMFLCVALSVVGFLTVDRRIGLLLIVWGWMPTLLIGFSGHPVHPRHMVTVCISFLLLAAYGIASLGGKMARAVSGPSTAGSVLESGGGLALGCVLALSLGAMTSDVKERIFSSEVSPFKNYATTIALDYPRADLLYVASNHVFTGTFLRWYLEGMSNVQQGLVMDGPKKVLVFGDDSEQGQPFKRLAGYLALPGYGLSGLSLRERAPLLVDGTLAGTVKSYLFDDVGVLEQVKSWKNVWINPEKKCLEPASRLQAAEMVFQLRFADQEPVGLVLGLSGFAQQGTRDIVELLTSADNKEYRLLSQADLHNTIGGDFRLEASLTPPPRAEDIYVKVRFLPGMVVPAAVLQSLDVRFVESGQEAVRMDTRAVRPSGVVAALSGEAFRDTRQADGSHVIHGATDTMQVAAPYFGDMFDLEKEVFLQNNVSVNRREGCLTCQDEKPCYFVYYMTSQKSYKQAKIVFYPRMFSDKSRSNYIRLSYSYDGLSYKPLWSSKNLATGIWEYQKQELSIPVSGDVRHLFLKFDLSGDGGQVISHDNSLMYFGVISSRQDNLTPQEIQQDRFKTLKRLLGM